MLMIPPPWRTRHTLHSGRRRLGVPTHYVDCHNAPLQAGLPALL